MATYGKYQVYYEKIKTEAEKIREENGYLNLSKAFAHWYLKNTLKMDEQDIAETIIDGNGDNGIDAITVQDAKMTLYQSKFPDKGKNIDKQIDEKTVLKIFNGYKKLVSVRKPRSMNENFLKSREIVKEKNIFDYEVVFVSFSNGFSQQALDAFESESEDIRDTTGNDIQHSLILQKNICDLYDRIQKKAKIDINITYKKLDQSYNLDENVKSFVGFVSAKKLIEACKQHMDVIFDENIRLYEGDDNNVNEGIYNTAIGEDSCNFFFYHNGIVLICDKCKNSTGNQSVLLEGASVVNGCQTINSLKRAYDELKLKDDVFIQFRIIETDDFDLRAKITEYLNSQTQIRDSYFLANNSFIRALQIELLNKEYFLERLSNEYAYKHRLGKVKEYDKKHILNLEKVIQIFAAFYFNEYAARAKSGKGELFDKKIAEILVSNIDATKVIHAVEWYDKISQIITLYRKCKRSNNHKMDFFEYMDMDVSDEEYQKVLSEFLFLNTGDLLLLNAISNLEKTSVYEDEQDMVIDAIKMCKNAVTKSKLQPYQATRNATVFAQIQKDVN